MLLRRIVKNTNWSICLFFHQTIRRNSLSLKRIGPPSVTDCSSDVLVANTRRFKLRELSSSTYINGSPSDNEFEIMEEFTEQGVSDTSPVRSFCLKNILYPDSEDKILIELNDSEVYEDVLQKFAHRKSEFQAQHFVQSVILLWNFRRNTHNVQVPNNESIISSKIFNEFLETMNNFVDRMNLDELTCCFLYLHKFGIDVGHPTMWKLLQQALDKISDSQEEIPLTALSRLTVGVNTCQDLNTFLVCKDVLPHVVKSIEKCESVDKLQLITICMQNLHQMISREILSVYGERVSSILEEGKINSNCTKCILKVINFLNYPHWAGDCFHLVRKLALILLEQNGDLSFKEIDTMFKLFQIHLEPASYMPKLSHSSEKLFQETQTPELLACIAHFSPPSRRNEMIQIVKKMIEDKTNYSQPTTVTSLFIILRSLKVPDMKVCNTFWTNTLQMILSNQDEQSNFKIARHCHRYMHFNNNLGGTYRHREFERKISEILMEELTDGISSMVPSKFARLSSFVLAYDCTSDENRFSNFILNKIEDMTEQFTVIDCLQLSRGLQIALEMRFRYFVPPGVAQQRARIDNVLNTCAKKHLETDLKLSDLNFVIRTLTNRRAPRGTNLYQKAIEKYRHPHDGINSRTIRDISFSLINSGYLIPEIIEQMLTYIVENKEYITGDTVEKVISCCYNLGYVPKTEDALYWSAEIIQRDFEYMTGLSIVQSCLALCFYKLVPESLINRIFSIDFIQRLEEEIHTCYSKATYPERVLNQVMQLNRAVCLDFPESQVPWFQQNYIEAQMSKKPIIQTRFHGEMKTMLISLLEGSEEYLRCNHITPYGYTIDFVIHFDRNKKPIPPQNEAAFPHHITKVAILLLKLDSFCKNDSTLMRGHEHLKMRHLEMLGYKVIHINLNDWNSMYMNVPGAKTNYLKSLLQIE